MMEFSAILVYKGKFIFTYLRLKYDLLTFLLMVNHTPNSFPIYEIVEILTPQG